MDLGNDLAEVDPIFVIGLNFSIRKSALFELGGFHPDAVPKKYQKFQGDGETGLTLKAKERGFKAIYQPEALVYHHVPKSRMTFEYFDKRFYYQGICDSFTCIRRKHGKYALIKLSQKTVRSRIQEPIKKPLSLVKKLFFKFIDSTTHEKSQEEIELRERFRKAYQQGYDFHQMAVSDNPKLMEWVLKDDYWDYQLPEIDIIPEDYKRSY